MSQHITKGGCIVQKKEMTQVMVGDNYQPVTLLKFLPAEVVRVKTQEKDGYDAMQVWVGKKDLNKTKGIKTAYSYMTEFKMSPEYVTNFETGTMLSPSVLQDIDTVTLVAISKGKGFQGGIKRFGLKGMPATHGHKFTRHLGSKGNRKPRRTQKWHPHAGHMWLEQITLKNRKIVEITELEGQHYVVVKWSVPGHYNSYLKLELQ
jgi:large subunit ribosomal protein L3